MASLRRSPNGSIAPIINSLFADRASWLHELTAESVPGTAVRADLLVGRIHAENSASRFGTGQGQVRYDSLETAENRSGDYSKHAPGKITVLQRVSLSGAVYQSGVQTSMLKD